jgi:glycine hydroxymethyltransferase
MMALDLPHGGHLSHGYQTPTKKISAVSKYFECLPYRLDEKTGLIDYEAIEEMAPRYRPKLLISGASAYSRHIDYARLRGIADSIGAYFLMDMAHISGLVAAGVLPCPFAHADLVSTTTHKSLRGPRGAMIFYRKGLRSVDKKGKETHYDLEEKINHSVFPGHQGGPHNHTITALAVALKLAQSPEFKAYQTQVVSNAQALAQSFINRGYDLVSGGTDNHLMLVNLRNKGLNGAKAETLLDLTNIVLNKNTVPDDVSALNPSGIRVGTPAMTSRGFKEADFETVAGFIDQGIQIALNIQKDSPKKTLASFKATIADGSQAADIASLKAEVVDFARLFEPIGQ